MEWTRALIIGAHGVLGTLTARAFEAQGWEVRRAARSPRAGEVYVDLDVPDTLLDAVRADELVVNTVPDRGLSAERVVLERGGALINTSTLPAAASRSLRAAAGGARGIVLMNAGLAPGVTNLLAAELLRVHPAADELEIVFTLSSHAARGNADVAFLERGVRALPRHSAVDVPLPEPFGARRCVGFAEDDAGWLGGVAEGRVVRCYVCVAEPTTHERLLELNDAGALAEEGRAMFGAQRPLPTGSATSEPVAHWVAAKRGPRRLGALSLECRGHFLGAALSTVAFAEQLAERERRGGCYDADEVFALADLAPRLLDAGVRVASTLPAPSVPPK